MIAKIVFRFLSWRAKTIDKINRWLLNKSWKAAEVKAAKMAKATGQKILILLWAGNYEAMTKQDFKKMWHSKPQMKKRTLEQWQKYVHEFSSNSK